MHRPAHTATSVLVGAALVASAAVVAPAAHADGSQPLRLTSFNRIVADEAHERLFLTTGRGGADDLLVLGLDGTYQQQVPLPGVTDVEVVGDVVYVAQHRYATITVLARDTLREKGSISTGGLCPGDLASTDGRLVFGYSSCSYGAGGGGVGVLQLADPLSPLVTTTLGPAYDPVLATSPGAPGLVLAGDDGLSPTTLSVLDVSGDNPFLVTQRRDTGSNLRDLAVSPDGTRAVSAQGYPYDHQVFSMSKLEAAGAFSSTHYPNAVGWSADGSRVAVGSDAAYDRDVYVYGGDGGTARQAVELGAGRHLQDRGLAVSSDGSTTWAVHGDVYDHNLAIRVVSDAANEPDLQVFTQPTGPLTAGEPVTIHGHLVFGDGAGTDGVHLGLIRHVTVAGATTTTTLPDVDASLGDWRFTDTPPAGQVSWTVTFAGDPVHRPASVSTTPVEVVAPDPVPAMTVDAPQTGAVGSPLTVRGTLTDGALTGPQPVAGALVTVSRAVAGETVVVGTATTSPNGAWSLTDVPALAGTTTYTARYPATTGVVQASDQTEVAPRDTVLTLTADRGRGRDNKTAYLVAQLGPTSSSRVVSLTASTEGGTPVPVASGVVDSTGRLAAEHELPKGLTLFTAAFAGDEGSAPAGATAVLHR